MGVWLIGLLTCLASAEAFLKRNELLAWDVVQAHYDPIPWNGFFDLPTRTSSSLMKDYVKVNLDLGAKADLYCYDQDDPRVCPIFDRAGNIAGVQVSLIEKDLGANLPFNYSRVSFYIKTNVFNQPAWSVRVWFTNPESLSDSGRLNTAETADGIFVYIDGKLFEFPRKDPKVAEYNGFTREACFPGMGLHYFYGLEVTQKCEDAFPLFSLYQKGSLVGFGVGGLGKQTKKNRQWFENPPSAVIKVIAPIRPACLTDWVDKYGISTVHFYLAKNSWSYMCIP